MTAITPQGPIEIVDRSSMITKLNDGVLLRPRETAIVTIDMHRGHLDMEVATMAAKPEDAKRVIANAKAARIACPHHYVPSSSARVNIQFN